MSLSLKPTTQDRLKRFNELFPAFYDQFVTNETQLHNLKLAYHLLKTRRVVIIPAKDSPDRTVFHFAYRNQTSLLRDLFGVLRAYNLTVHDLSIHGQVHNPMLVFVKLSVSRGSKALQPKTIENVRRAMLEALSGRFQVEEMISTEIIPEENSLAGVKTEFYIDQVHHVPALLIQATDSARTLDTHHTVLMYKAMSAVAKEDVMVVNSNLLCWQGSTRLILYVLTANAGQIPDYVGNKMAERVKRALTK
jgi:hypothetical protein